MGNSWFLNIESLVNLNLNYWKNWEWNNFNDVGINSKQVFP